MLLANGPWVHCYKDDENNKEQQLFIDRTPYTTRGLCDYVYCINSQGDMLSDMCLYLPYRRD